MKHGSYVALFDVLGFEDRLNHLGLDGMLSRYEALIASINSHNDHAHRLFGDLNFHESPYWTDNGDLVIFSRIEGAYASDSILLWANRTWPESQAGVGGSNETPSAAPTDDWRLHPIPCDSFLNVCNELMCCGLEVGLPLRGAISIGSAIMDRTRGIFLGKPIVESARLERGQGLVGVSFSKSMTQQHVPARFALDFGKHLKEKYKPLWGGHLLDWPRHWRQTRAKDVRGVISALDVNPQFSKYYANTLEMVSFSEGLADKYESEEDVSIRSQYEQFSWSNTKVTARLRAVRKK